MNFKVTIALVLLQAFQSQSLTPLPTVTIAEEPDCCPSEHERETVHQIIRMNVSNVIANFIAGRNGSNNGQ